jgi:hypothetical protein
MTIYLNKTNSLSASYEQIGAHHQKIHTIVSSGSQDTVPEGFSDTCKALGHSASRINELWKFCHRVHIEPLKGIPIGYSNDITGIFRLHDERHNSVAVFKIGSRRAATEILASELAHKIGLGDHFITGTFCAMESLPKSPELLIQLWNGKFAEYSLKPKLMVGIIEEYATDEFLPGVSQHEAFVKMVTLALSIGLRDAKTDGITKNSFRIFDADQCFPRRFQPILTDASSAVKELAEQPAMTDLQFLADYKALAETKLPQDLIAKMKAIVSKWDLDEIKKFLQNQPIRFPDVKAENGEKRDDSGSKITIIDDPEELQQLCDKISVLEGFENKMPVFAELSFKLTDNMLHADQISATLERMKRVKNFFAEIAGPDSTCIDLIKESDPYWAKLIETNFTLLPSLDENKSQEHSKTDKEIAQINKELIRWQSDIYRNAGSSSPFKIGKALLTPVASKLQRELSGSQTPLNLDESSTNHTPKSSPSSSDGSFISIVSSPYRSSPPSEKKQNK